MYKVRFHLGQGEHYLHWQVSNKGRKTYYKPDEVTLEMKGCKLHNTSTIANKIHKGEHKSVCAWILCKSVKVCKPKATKGEKISFNPRLVPYWCDTHGNNLDGCETPALSTFGRSVFCAATVKAKLFSLV